MVKFEIHKVIFCLADGKSKNLEFTHDSAKYTLVIKKPGVNAANEWSIAMHV